MRSRNLGAEHNCRFPRAQVAHILAGRQIGAAHQASGPIMNRKLLSGIFVLLVLSLALTLIVAVSAQSTAAPAPSPSAPAGHGQGALQSPPPNLAGKKAEEAFKNIQ